MEKSETVELKIPMNVSLKLTSLSDDWIEGYIELKIDDSLFSQHFKTKNGAKQDFNISTQLGIVKVHAKAYLETPHRACIEGYVEKVIQIPFHICANI